MQKLLEIYRGMFGVELFLTKEIDPGTFLVVRILCKQQY